LYYSKNSVQSGYGGGAYCIAGTYINTIIYGNMFPDIDGVDFGEFTNCCSPYLTIVAGNITNAPLFANADYGNFHQLVGSPVIDAGTNAFAPMPYDLDGNPRIYDGTVDMGCYEFVPEPAGIVFSILSCFALMLRRINIQFFNFRKVEKM